MIWLATSVYDDFMKESVPLMAAQVTGDPTDPGITYGPCPPSRPRSPR
jgi:acyl-CoA reductase-like NAD-dependent aldehyde dehydrogenase